MLTIGLTLKYCLIVLPLVVLYNEFIIHRIQPWYWNELDCNASDGTCTKMLLIADPQIQGELAVPPPLSLLFNWDSDRYLRHTFNMAMKHFKPDVLIFLGDLMDEGSISTKEQFHAYIKRLATIFETTEPVLQVWVPGDNDIGGENERVSNSKVKEFNSAFKQPDVITIPKNIVIYKVNKITHTMPKILEGHEPNEDNFNIVVSHYPILGTGIFAQKVINELRPNLFFCGHDHTAKLVESPKRSFYGTITRPMSPGSGVVEINFDNNTNYEIFVPTCSYRMGVPKMGYGAAVFENNNKRLRYNVLWSSGRFPILFFYLAVLLVLFTYLLAFFIYKMMCIRSSKSLY